MDARAPIAQSAEAGDLKSLQCGFESHWGYARYGRDVTEAGDYPRWVRFAVGRPRVWNGVAWLVMGVIWLLYALFSGTSGLWPLLLAAVWSVFGAAMLVVAVRDRGRRRGSYSPQQPSA